MEFLDGEPLDALLERRPVLPVADAVDLMLPVISAVSTAHEHGVIGPETIDQLRKKPIGLLIGIGTGAHPARG